VHRTKKVIEITLGLSADVHGPRSKNKKRTGLGFSARKTNGARTIDSTLLRLLDCMNVGASHSSCSDQSRKTFAAPSAFKGRFPFIVRGSALAASSTLTPASAVLEPRGEGAMAAVDSNDPVVYIERIADTHRFEIKFVDVYDPNSRLRKAKVVVTIRSMKQAKSFEMTSAVWASKELARREVAHLLLNDVAFQKELVAMGVSMDRKRQCWCPCSLCRPPSSQ